MDKPIEAAPGAIQIRPTRLRAEREPDQFYPLLEAFRDPDILPLRKIAELSGDRSLNPEPNTLRKLKSQTLSDEARRVLLRHIFDDERLLFGKRREALDLIDDAFYFAFLNYFHACDVVQDEARAKIIGTYKYWRYAADRDDEFALGRLTFSEDKDSRALKVEARLKECGIARTSSDWLLRGYAFAIDETLLFFTRRHGGNLRLTILPRARTSTVGTAINPRSVFAGHHEHIVHMDGLTIGLDRGNCFLSPIHVSLVDDVDELANLDASLDVMTEDDPRLPRRIVKRLRKSGPLRRL
ncbi:hypothetical protein [Bradyrhizobium sp. CCGUVB14]|uniref:hypothetical protein n=1 Tax=Bradyrhizobium sp. CCGUVB14 TaxID=2949628 RepID=UPI0020B1F98E|nr:hypothetical protein [Bradyrhizobium sp. CCGUVB14]MCP3439808.1 hypothetical protein [Bradyrhizobium sp. CCGUVB14]